ncbi:hypothetical protein OH492_14390 [Vibrio chagasii]|nr:hypothetical protein [Vibrio chagasii]
MENEIGAFEKHNRLKSVSIFGPAFIIWQQCQAKVCPYSGYQPRNIPMSSFRLANETCFANICSFATKKVFIRADFVHYAIDASGKEPLETSYAAMLMISFIGNGRTSNMFFTQPTR